MTENEQLVTKALLEKLYAFSLEMLCVADMNGYFLHVNPAMQRTLGRSVDALVSSPFLEFVHPDDKESTIREMHKLAEGIESIEFENRYRLADGEYIWLSWVAAPDVESNLIYAAARNISDRKEMEARLKRKQRLESVGTFATGIAHDLNNILATILMAADYLPTSQPTIDADSKQMIELIHANSLRGGKLVEQILAFAKGAESPHAMVDLLPLVGEIATNLRQFLPHGIQLKTAVADNLKPVFGNETQLYQLLSNLCFNARDAISDTGTITLKLDNLWLEKPTEEATKNLTRGWHIRIRVSDDGAGIPSEMHETVFNPFFTSKTGGKRSVGLGLATALNITQKHNGAITFESEPGTGTTFIVYLPAGAE